jgi:EmrB/QacA subfamily drug resistance transporter
VPQVSLSHSEILQTLGVLMLGLFLGALEQSIVATALPSMARDLGQIHLLAWVVTAYMLAAVAATPILGKLSDLHGRRAVLRLSVVCFMGSSLVCALAVNMTMLLIGRVLQGLGGAGLITIAQAGVADIIAPRERGRYGGFIALVWASAGLIGPLVGGLLTEYLSWRWIFLINLPLGVLLLLLTSQRLRGVSQHRGKARIHYLDVIVFVSGVTGLLLGLTWGGNTFDWLSGPVVTCFIAAALFGGVFAFRERRVAEPLIPPQYLRHPVIAPIFGIAFLVYGIYFSIAVLVPTYFQLGMSQTPARAGGLLIPVMLSSSALAFFSGLYVTHTGNYRLPPVIGLPMAVGALIVLGFRASDVTPGHAMLLLALVGFGIGPIFPIINVVAQNAAPSHQIGAVTGGVAFFRMLGGAVLTSLGSVLILSFTHAVTSLARLDPNSLSPESRRAFCNGFGTLFLAEATALVVALTLFLTIKELPLRSASDIRPDTTD